MEWRVLLLRGLREFADHHLGCLNTIQAGKSQRPTPRQTPVRENHQQKEAQKGAKSRRLLLQFTTAHPRSHSHKLRPATQENNEQRLAAMDRRKME